MSTDAFTFLPEHDQSDNSESRYGNYLALAADRFREPSHDDITGDEFTTDPAVFALTALYVANYGMMPPYVLNHTHVVGVEVAYGDNHSRPLLRVKLGVPRNIAFGGTLRGMADWNRGVHTGNLIEPASPIEASAVSMIAFTLPLDHLGLPEPRYTDLVTPDTDTAKAALRILVEYANTQLRPALTSIMRNDRVRAS